MASSEVGTEPPLLIGATAEDSDADIEEDEALRAPSGLKRFKGAGSTVVLALRVRKPLSGCSRKGLPAGKPVHSDPVNQHMLCSSHPHSACQRRALSCRRQ